MKTIQNFKRKMIKNLARSICKETKDTIQLIRSGNARKFTIAELNEYSHQIMYIKSFADSVLDGTIKYYNSHYFFDNTSCPLRSWNPIPISYFSLLEDGEDLMFLYTLFTKNQILIDQAETLKYIVANNPFSDK